MSESHAGACLCGKVQITLPADKTRVGACHCAMCRKWSGGGPYMAIHTGPELVVQGAEHIQRFQSSPWAERGFCRECGTHLFYHLKGGDYMLAAGLFSGAELELGREIFVEQKPDWYGFLSDGSEKKTKAQVMGG